MTPSLLLDALTDLLAAPDRARCAGQPKMVTPTAGCPCAGGNNVIALAAQVLDAAFTLYATDPAEQRESEEPDISRPGTAPGPVGIVEACLAAFAELGDPDAMGSEDLVFLLRVAPGFAVGRWRFADLTQARLAHLLAPYEVQTRDITLPDGRRRKAYRLSALLAAEAATSR